MENINLTPLNPYLKTRKDAADFILLVEVVMKKLYEENLTIEKVFKESLPYDLANTLSKITKEGNIQDKQSLQTFFDKLREHISTLPVVHLILAVKPTPEVIDSMTNWFYIQFKKTVLMDITIDEELLGGAVISFAGRANEYSLRNKIEQMQTSD